MRWPACPVSVSIDAAEQANEPDSYRVRVSCYSCEQEADLATGPAAEQVYVGQHWRVVHAMHCPVPGWLIVLPRRHTTAISQHTPAEAAELGRLLVAVSGAIEEYIGCAKTYVAQFAEAHGFAHTHFHVIPRPDDLSLDRLGPAVFAYLSGPEAEHLPLEQRNAIAVALRPLIVARLGPIG